MKTKSAKSASTSKPKLSWAGRSAYIQKLVVQKLEPAQIVEKTKVKFPQSSKGRVLEMIKRAKKAITGK